MFVWHVLRIRDGRFETVDAWPTLADIIWEMACSSWEEPGNGWLSYVVDEETGEAVATAMFGPEESLLVTVSDGRQFRFPMPEFYRGARASEPAAELPQ